MAKRSISAARQNLDAEAVLGFIRQRFSRHRHSLQEIVAQLVSVATFDPEFDKEIRIRGLTDWAGDYLLRSPRDEILHSVISVTQHEQEDREPIQVTVTRSALRDWPIGSNNGLPFERCTPEDIETEIYHSQRTVDGIMRRIYVLQCAVKEARDRGVGVMGELDDDLLNACLEKGRE